MTNQKINKINICLVQLGRIGDILQTIIAVKNFSSDNLQFTLICRQSFGKPLNYLLSKYFREVVFIDTDSLFTDSKNLNDCVKKLDSSLSSISNLEPNAVVNLTFSKPAAYLMSLIDAPLKFGQEFISLTQFNISDTWSQYLYSNVMTGPYSNFNLVDLLQKIIGLPYTPELVKNKKRKNKKLKTVTINPFASHSKKHWRMSRWSQVINWLIGDKDIMVNLIGASSEEGLASELIKDLNKDNIGKIKNLVGKTSLEELTPILENTDLFLGHDSMASHLASLHNVQTLTISLGTVRPIETIPYAENHYALVPNISCFPCYPTDPCESFECHTQIDERLVALLADKIINSESSEDLIIEGDLEKLFSNCSLYQSKFSEYALKTEKVFPTNVSAKEVMSKFYFKTWLFVLSEKEEFLDIPQVSPESREILSKYLEGFEYLYELNGFAKNFCKTIANEAKKNSNVEKIKENSNKLKEIEILTQSIKKEFPLVSPIINYTALKLKLNNGNDLVELSENALLIYHEESLVISIMYDFISKTIEHSSNFSKASLKSVP